MKSTVSKWCEGERVKLAEVVPLDTPISLVIEPANVCNFRCYYCHSVPKAGEIKKANALLELSLFEKAMDDVKKFPRPIKAINFSRAGEPLLNKNIARMVALAKKGGMIQTSKIITNGSLLNPRLNLELIDAGLDVLRISIQGLTEEQVFKTCGFRLKLPSFLESIRHFYANRGSCKVFIKILDSVLGDQKDKFMEMFGDICDQIAIEHEIVGHPPPAEDRGKTEIVNMMQEKTAPVDVCASPFYSLGIFADGGISGCCADIGRGIIFGNVKTDSLVDVWQSPKMNAFRLMQLGGKRYDHPACGHCCVPTYVLQRNDNIDSEKERLIEYYRRSNERH